MADAPDAAMRRILEELEANRQSRRTAWATLQRLRKFLEANVSKADRQKNLSNRKSAVISCMPNRNSRYKKVLFEEHMPIERTSKSRILAVIIEVTGPIQADPKDLQMINFAYDIIRTRIENEGWAPAGKSVRHIGFDQLPVLGAPDKEEGNLFGWIVEA
jgi:hypothetical protein